MTAGSQQQCPGQRPGARAAGPAPPHPREPRQGAVELAEPPEGTPSSRSFLKPEAHG